MSEASDFKYNPRLKDTGPNGPLEVTVDLPDGADSQTIFEAMEEAAQVAGLTDEWAEGKRKAGLE